MIISGMSTAVVRVILRCRQNCPQCITIRHSLPDVLIKLDLRPEERSMDNICQFDVYWIVRQVIKVLEVIEVEAKDIKFEDIAAIGIAGVKPSKVTEGD